ncbi:putative phosphoadenosine phosphosulfate reductase [Rosellinia necatrix]|uniref:Putative phosphoadenosine phosphosulfate reductase n=1 Tax=Rosellinia necatrix TaxID=77044 RepID=A0A1W2TCI9_ROSNE|nr:putative phosphoadenosine phosphosulfate reductase [Rosellinia necatrix]
MTYEEDLFESDPSHNLGNKMDVNVYRDSESGYGSRSSSFSSSRDSPRIVFTELHLKHLNEQFERLSPQDILRMSKLIFPNLYQTTAFGLTGLVTLDMLSKLHAETPGSSPVEVIFLDTLYHFEETHQLVARVKERYPASKIHTFFPDGCRTASQFEERHGGRLWEVNAERYDYLAKVEPQQRSYEALGVAAVLTGRRRSQGAARGGLPIVEMDRERGTVKVNPLARWSFEQVREYARAHGVPYNALLDRGYKSVGDWHSTQPVAEGEDERAGRWKGQPKTECGIHNNKSRYAAFLAELARQQAAEEAATFKAADAAKPKALTALTPTTGVAAAAASTSDEAPARAVKDIPVVPASLQHESRVTKPGRKIGLSRGSWTARRLRVVQKLRQKIGV